MGDFAPDRLDSRSLQTLWEQKNRVLLEEYYIFDVAITIQTRTMTLNTLGVEESSSKITSNTRDNTRATSPLASVSCASPPLHTVFPLGCPAWAPPRGGPGACRRGGPGRNYEPLSTLSYNRANPSPHCITINTRESTRKVLRNYHLLTDFPYFLQTFS